MKGSDIILLENNYQPKNVSKEHYELCQIAKYFLKSKGYNIIGEEIELKHSDYLKQFKLFNNHKNTKCRIDVVGLNLSGTFYSYTPHKYIDGKVIWDDKLAYNEPVFKSMGIEAKVSLSDFKNGFNTACEKTYIIAPIGVIPLDLIPKNIGLIEVDLDNYEIKNTSDGFMFNGVNETIKAKINLDPKFTLRDKPSNNEEYQTFCKDLLRFIAYRYTMDDLYKKCQIVI